MKEDSAERYAACARGLASSTAAPMWSKGLFIKRDRVSPPKKSMSGAGNGRLRSCCRLFNRCHFFFCQASEKKNTVGKKKKIGVLFDFFLKFFEITARDEKNA